MRFFGENKCRAVILCGTLFAFGGLTQNLNAQETQGSSRSSDIAQFDAFLDAHAEIDSQLRANPSLLTNAEYLEAHPQLQMFINQHPQVQTQIGRNSSFFMERERRFDARERNPRGQNPNPDLTREQVATLDRFLDNHQDIDQTLRKNPWLIRNAQYLQEHPELQTFLNQHPELKEESAETPAFLMQREKRFDSREASRGDVDRDVDRDANVRRDRDFDRSRDRDADRDRDVNRDRDANASRDFDSRSNPNRDREAASMGDFLDRHQDIAKSLEKKPELITDRGYMKRHKDLDEFLNEHPAVRQEMSENPSSFMRREDQFEARNVDRDRLARDRDRGRDVDSDRDRDVERGRVRDRDDRADADLDNKDLQDMDHFLDKHKKIEKDLQKNPSLVTDEKYLKHHKPLEEFLSKNPQVGRELKENPSAFMQKQARLEQRKMNNHQTMQKHKTKIEEKEQTHTATPH